MPAHRWSVRDLCRCASTRVSGFAAEGRCFPHMNVILGRLGVEVEESQAFTTELIREYFQHPVLSHRIRRVYHNIEYRQAPIARPALITRDSILTDEVLAWWHFLYQTSRWLGRVEVIASIRSLSPCCACLSCTSSWCDTCELDGLYTPLCSTCEEEDIGCPVCCRAQRPTSQ